MLTHIPVLLSAMANAVLGLKAPIPDYDVPEPYLPGQAFPDRPKLNLTGTTIQEIHDQLTKLNPNLDADKQETGIRPAGGDALNNICDDDGGSWHPARESPITEGIRYLRKVPNKPTMMGPGCDRVSCSWKSAILWCNDNADSFSLDSFDTIADCAQVVLDSCLVSDFGEEGFVVGQLHNDGNWRCIVRSDKC